MTIIVNPYIKLASVSDRDKFLSLVRDVAQETQANEPECLAYCWTYELPVIEGSRESSSQVHGLEVYRTAEALTATHRSSNSYKHMRTVVATTGLLSYPKGGVPIYVAAGAGFLWKQGVRETVTLDDHFVVIRYSVDGRETLSRFLQEERLLSEEMHSMDGVLAFWAFVPDGNIEEDTVTIFIRFASKAHYRNLIKDGIQKFEDAVLNWDGVDKTRFWEGQGFGFFRQQE